MRQLNRLTVTIIMTLLALLITSTSAYAGKKATKKAVKALNASFKGVSFTALVPLHVHGWHNVAPDGKPLEGDQSKRKGSKGIGTKDYAVDQGETGAGMGFYLKGKDTIQVTLMKKSGMAGAWNPSNVLIEFGRDIDPGEVTQEMIAQALSSLVVIDGFEPDAGLDQALADLDEKLMQSGEAAVANQSPAPASETPARPTVVSLVAKVEPASLMRGQEIDLVVEYEIAAPHGEVEVRETRYLEESGKSLPTYPVSEVVWRGAGRFVSTFTQPVPAAAVSGTYIYRGEVCVGGDCISRTISFEVR